MSWGNGVLYDADKDWADTLSMVEAGLLKPELALAQKYDLPSETPEDLAAIREKYMPVSYTHLAVRGNGAAGRREQSGPRKPHQGASAGDEQSADH